MRLPAASVGLVLLLAGCTTPRFADAGDQGTISELTSRAELIVAGKVTALRAVDRHRQDACSKLMSADVAVDHVLKGDAAGPELRYYYYSPRCGSTRNVSEGPQAGAWRIVFLRRDQGYWRAVADGWRDGVLLGSGRHPAFQPAGRTPRQAIAELLLTPGEARSAGEFAESVAASSILAVQLAGREETGRLLHALIAEGPLPVRPAACLALASDAAIRDCAGPVLTEYSERFERGDFSGLSQGLVRRLDALANRARRDVADRAGSWLPLASVAVGLPAQPGRVLISE